LDEIDTKVDKSISDFDEQIAKENSKILYMNFMKEPRTRKQELIGKIEEKLSKS